MLVTISAHLEIGKCDVSSRGCAEKLLIFNRFRINALFKSAASPRHPDYSFSRVIALVFVEVREEAFSFGEIYSLLCKHDQRWNHESSRYQRYAKPGTSFVFFAARA